MPKGIHVSGKRFAGIKIFGIAIGSARSVGKMEKELTYYAKKYLYHVGATMMVPNCNGYCLFSLNGGEDWYAVDEHDRIVGPAEKIYPGLLAHLDAWKALEEAGKHGPIDPGSTRGKQLLEAVGFQVNKK